MTVSRLINAPIERVWDILTDTQLWPLWGPSLNAVDCPQRYISDGLEGQVKTSLGPWVSFVITRYEPPVYWHWKVAGISATGHRLEKLGTDSCKLSFEIPLPAFPYALICRQAANNIARLAEENVNF